MGLFQLLCFEAAGKYLYFGEEEYLSPADRSSLIFYIFSLLITNNMVAVFLNETCLRRFVLCY